MIKRGGADLCSISYKLLRPARSKKSQPWFLQLLPLSGLLDQSRVRWPSPLVD